MAQPQPRIRVCFISAGAASLVFPERESRHGGAEAQFYMLARELAKLDEFDVHLVVNGSQGQLAVKRDRVTVHSLPFLPGIRPKLLLQRLLHFIDAQIYLQRASGSVTKEVAFFCLWRRRTFLYWIAHDNNVDPEVYPTATPRTKSFEWGMLRAHSLVAQTEFQARRLRERYNRDSVIIANAFPPRQPPGDPRAGLLWVGRFVAFKQPQEFIRLARALDEEQCTMIAPVSTDTSRRLFEQHAAGIETTQNLKYISSVPFHEITRYFDGAKILVSTSRSEGFPNTFVQAMWSATPIASLDYDPDGIIARHQLGVPPTGDFDAFAREIRGLLADPERLERCGANAHSYAHEHHNLERNAQKLAEHLRRLAPGHIP